MTHEKLPEPVLAAFDALAREQRGAPEEAMLAAQEALGGGALSHLVEHVGDLTNRMAKRAFNDAEGGGHSKVESTLYLLRQGGHSHRGFASEVSENAQRNARSRGVPLADYLARADAALATYAAEHRKLPVYNQAQFAAREAAVALGERRYGEAVKMLEHLEALIADGTWASAVREYRLGPDGGVLTFPWPEHEANARRLRFQPGDVVRQYDGVQRVVESTGEVDGQPVVYFVPDPEAGEDWCLAEEVTMVRRGAALTPNARSGERVEVGGTTYPDGTPLPAHLRVYGVRKIVHGVPVVEVSKVWYLSPDLRVRAERQSVSEGFAGSGWLLVDERTGADSGGYIPTKAEALRAMVEWAEQIASR